MEMDAVRRLNPNQYSRLGDSLLRELGPAGLEWSRDLEAPRDRVRVYCTDGLRHFMLIVRETNVLIATDSPGILDGLLRKLDPKKDYAFRCQEWMAPAVLGRFPPKRPGHAGVVLLTFATGEDEFSGFSDARYAGRVLGEDDADEVMASSGPRWGPEFVRERIRKGEFRGIFEGGHLVSWLGTVWESDRACELGFAFTKEEHRGQGLMKVLASAITEEVLRRRKTPLLHTVEGNLPAKRVAESLGFRVKGREWAYDYSP